MYYPDAILCSPGASRQGFRQGVTYYLPCNCASSHSRSSRVVEDRSGRVHAILGSTARTRDETAAPALLEAVLMGRDASDSREQGRNSADGCGEDRLLSCLSLFYNQFYASPNR